MKMEQECRKKNIPMKLVPKTKEEEERDTFESYQLYCRMNGEILPQTGPKPKVQEPAQKRKLPIIEEDWDSPASPQPALVIDEDIPAKRPKLIPVVKQEVE